MRNVIYLIAAIFLLSGFKNLKDSDVGEVQNQLEIRTGKNWDISFRPEKIAKPSADLATLSLENALEMAFSRNPEFQGLAQKIGIARSERLSASLPENPEVEGMVRFPNNNERNNWEVRVTQNVADLFQTTLKRRVANAALDQVKLETLAAALELLIETKKAFYEAQASDQTLSIYRDYAMAAEAARDLAEELFKAGNINSIEYGIQKDAYEQAKIAYLETETQRKLAWEPLYRLLGLEHSETLSIQTKNPLAAIPNETFNLDKLIDQATKNRVDLAVVQQETEVFRRKITQAKFGAFQNVSAGFDMEREASGDRLVGPAAKASVPAWNWNQGGIGKAQYEFQQSQFHFQSMRQQILSEVRESAARVTLQQELSQRLEKRIIPIRHKLVVDLQKHYNFMLIGAFQLLEAKQRELQANIDWVNAVKSYWIAKADLEHAVGGNVSPEAQIFSPKVLDDSEDSTYDSKSTESQNSMPTHAHHHGLHGGMAT